MATQLKNDTVFDSANSGDTAEECELSDLDEHYAVIDHLQRETSVLQEWNDVVETLTSELEMAQIAIEELRREKQTLLDELTANKNSASEANTMLNDAAVEALQSESEQLREEHEKLNAQLAEKDAEIEALRAADKAIEIDIEE